MSVKRCGVEFPNMDKTCLRAEGHYTYATPCFCIMTDPADDYFGMGVYMWKDFSTECVDYVPDDVILEVTNVR